MSENWESEPVKTTHRMRRFIIYVALLLLAFLLGFVPMWFKSRACSSSLAEAGRQSILARMETSLASAAIDARRGDYEKAREPVRQRVEVWLFLTSVGWPDRLLPTMPTRSTWRGMRGGL